MSDTTKDQAAAGAARIPPELRIEIATIAQDVTAPVSGFTLQPRDDILLRRGGPDGVKLYQDLARDGHAGSVLRKRRQAVIAREWTVEAGGTGPDDLLAAELVRVALRRANFDQACQALLGAVLTGHAEVELLWEAAELVVDPRPEDQREGGAELPARPWIVPTFEPRNPRRFRFDQGKRLRLLTWEAPIDGIELPDRKFLLLRFAAEETEDPYGRGLGHDLFWPVFFKRSGVALWNKALERFGQPFPYAEYPPGTPQNERNELRNAIADIGSGGGLIVPQGTLIKLLETKMTGTDGGHGALVAAMNAEISKIVLGETLTTEMGSNGARAASETHDGVRQELADADADLLCAELNRTLVRWIVELNLPGATPPTIWRRAPEEVDLKARAELDKTLFDTGWEAEESYVHDTFGPHYRRKEVKPPPVPPGLVPRPPLELAARDVTPAPALLAERLQADGAPAQAALLNAIRAEVLAAASYEDLEERLLRLSATMPIDGVAELVERMMQLAALAGAAEIADRMPARPPAAG
jgi:phage gp29-like protein